jgi:UDP-N-acetylmuramoyl-tripeptide--D-alanyl-D-alanine ligase
LNTLQGVPMTLLRLRPEHQFAVVEMGMDRMGEIQSYCDWSAPHVGVITNIGPVHMEKLGSLANIAKAKSELVQALPADGVAVLNSDDAMVMEMGALTRARVMTYGLTAKADIWADEIEGHGLDGTSFTLHQGLMAQRVRVPLLGGHSAYTALRAACTGLALGMSWGEIVEGLVKSPDEQLRLVVTKGPHGSIVLDDSYNASAESNIAALNLLKDINEGVRVAVLGDMFELGGAERQQHDEVGCRAGVVADFVVGVGKRAEWICAAAVECGLAKDHVFHVMTNAQAIDVLRGLITQKSAILVKGSRGMQMEEIVQGLEGLASA